MQCPKCQSAFTSVRYEGVDVDRCAACGGIWLDAGEKEALQNDRGAGGIDTGSKRVGRRYNQVRGCACPLCGDVMLRMIYSTQQHIEFESCSSCGGTFFDAGEFRDLTELTVLERLRHLIDVSLGVR